MSAAMLEVENLKAWYGAAQILFEPSFHVGRGEVEGWLEQDLRGAVPRLQILHLEHECAHGRASAVGVKVRPVPR